MNDALVSLDAGFNALYTKEGRPSIAPERLIRASLLQMLFSIRPERQLIEQMDYNLLFRWFVGLGIDDTVWVPTVFTKNRDRLLTTDMSRKVMAADPGASRGSAAAIGRALLGGRHAGQGVRHGSPTDGDTMAHPR
ncbi:Transposase domain [Salinihabitans flavidus]|uniref:Transposase domain n=1 Tax=Salinihabitans flavidus TaxID=569882 RepID=A0A1H8V277_9RHOB|nr:Transposase domain [Salinihabitans flavidus]